MFTDPAVIAVLNPHTLAVVWLGAFAGALAAGGAGFAYGVIGSAIWLHVLNPVQATTLVVSGGTIIQLGLFWQMRRAIEPGRLWPFLAAGLVGIPVGVALLVRTDAHALKFALGIFLSLYGIYALFAPRLPRLGGGGRAADAAVGFAGGILGGIGGYSGVLPAIWTQLRGWPKDICRAVYQPFILMAHIVTFALLGVVALDRAGLVLFLAALPALALGAGIGWLIYGRLDERRFQQMFAAVLVISGILLVL